ncbi:hypothetical protein D3C77_528100 [compost metagenome]
MKPAPTIRAWMRSLAVPVARWAVAACRPSCALRAWRPVPVPTPSSSVVAWSACSIASRLASAWAPCCRRSAACSLRASSGWPGTCRPVAPWCSMPVPFKPCARPTRACCRSASKPCRGVSAVARWSSVSVRTVWKSPAAWPTTAPWKHRRSSASLRKPSRACWATSPSLSWFTATT